MASQINLPEGLCPELHLMIYDYPDYGDAMRLARTNHFFSASVNVPQWPSATKASFVQEAQHWQRYNLFRKATGAFDQRQPALTAVSNNFACFYCFRVLQKDQFTRSKTQSRQSKGVQSRER